MKKHIYTIIAFAVFAASAFASQIPEQNVNMTIPFAFQAGGYTLPAGTYTISQPTAGYLLIRGFKGGIFVPATALVTDIDGGKSTFRFTRAGDKYVLQGVGTEK